MKSSAAQAVLILVVMLLSPCVQAAPTCNAGLGVAAFACTDPQAFPIYTRSFAAISGQKYWVRTATLNNYTGFSNTVDTVVRVLNTSNNTVVASDDDVAPGQLNSDLEFTASGTFTALVVVHSYAHHGFGRADVLVNNTTSATPGTPIWSTTQAVFGGFGTDVEVRNGDRVFSGPNPGVTSLTSSILVLSNPNVNCTSGCGSYAGLTGTGSSLENFGRAFIGFTDSTSRIYAGAEAPIGPVSMRWFHARRSAGWGGAQQYSDTDGDGLTWEIEALDGSVDAALLVDTCDTGVGPSTDCSGGRVFAARDSAWSGADTDNDGIRDGDELTAVETGCTVIPVSPYFNAGTCVNATWDPFTSYTHRPALAVSVLGANPRDYDVYLLAQPQTGQNLTNAEWTQMQWPYEVEGLQCADSTGTPGVDCGTDSFRQIRVHQVIALSVPALQWHQNLSHAWPAFDYFNTALSSDRKHTGVFRYAQFIDRGFWAWSRERMLVTFGTTVDPTTPGRANRVFSHELGHGLGLDHAGLGNAPGGEANYTSLMGPYRERPPKPAPGTSIWPAAALGTPCTSPGYACAGGTVCSGGAAFGNGYCQPLCPCAAGLTCITRGATQYCAPCNQIAARFSRGYAPDVNESSPPPTLTELNVLPVWAADQLCYNAATINSVACTGGGCTADFNADNDSTDNAAALDITDVDLTEDGDRTDNTTADDDWWLMYDLGKDAVAISDPKNMRREYFRVYQSLFDGAATDVSAWGQAATPVNITTSATSAQAGNYGSSLNFAGPGAGASSVALAASQSLRTLGNTVDGLGPNGFRFDIHVAMDAAASNTQHEILSSSLFRVYTTFVAGTSHAVNFTLTNGLIPVTIANNTDLIIEGGGWYWITAVYIRGSGRMLLTVVRDTTSWQNMQPLFGSCVDTPTALAPNLNPGTITIGLNPSSGTAWHGRLDEPRLFNYTDCAYFGTSDPIGSYCASPCGDHGGL